MDKISFLEGLKANLPFSNPTVGAIYFTTDTQEFYIGLSETQLVPLNSELIKEYATNYTDTAVEANKPGSLTDAEIDEICGIIDGEDLNSPSIDATLTVGGAAADAKATGDKINEVNDSLNDKIDGLTYEDVGAAAAGFGLGGDEKVLTADDDVDTLANGWYIVGAVVPQNMPSVLGYQDYCYIHVSNYIQYFHPVRTVLSGYIARRYPVDAGWSELEWVNPPMVAGVEYRTTKRWSEQAIYTKMVDCGHLPNNSIKTVAHDLPTTYITIRMECVAIERYGGYAINVPYVENSGAIVGVRKMPDTIQLESNVDASAYRAYCTLFYVKG